MLLHIVLCCRVHPCPVPTLFWSFSQQRHGVFVSLTTRLLIALGLLRQYVISQIPGLEILDDTEVLEKERAQARKTYRLQQSSHSRRKRKEDSSKKHTHMKTKSNAII